MPAMARRKTKKCIHCTKCPRRFHSWISLQHHIRLSPRHPARALCTQCYIWFPDHDDLEKHNHDDVPKSRTGWTTLKGKTFYHWADWQMYLCSSASSTGTIVLCKPCGIWFEQDSELQEHLQNARVHDKGKKLDARARKMKSSQQVHKENHSGPTTKKQEHSDTASHQGCSIQFDDYTGPQAHDRYFKVHTTTNYTRSDVFENQHEETYHLEAPSQHWRCPEPNCGLGYTSKDNHVKAAHSLRCPVCHEELPEAQFIEHLDSTHPRCYPCDERFDTVYDFALHKAWNNNHMWCEVCCVEIGSMGLLRSHYEQCHPSLYCQKCRIIFSNNNETMRHLEQSSEHAWCQKCKKEFNSTDALAQHKAESSSDGSGRHWYCTQCSEDFDSQTERHEHYIVLDSHHYCHLCQLLFQKKDQLRAHYVVKAMQDLKSHFRCPTCDQVFGGRHEVLEHHMRLHQSLSDNAICIVQYSDNNALQSHVDTEPGIRHYCEDCEAGFASETDLEVHWLRNWMSHHYCSQCSLKFPTTGDLKHHLEDSPGVHHFCLPCNTMFVSSAKLEQHTRMEHPPVPVSLNTVGYMDSESEDDLEQSRPRHEQRYKVSTDDRKRVFCG